ncbi:hypothetical protein CPC08DRAFT_173507 [Agrocybe pediades]|nr:hypothetical protein CPC08DRAFT_173507 [Agrocybe pediades]
MHQQLSFTRSVSAAQDDSELVDQLNALLSALNIPITLLAPRELTPGLLIMILEQVMGQALPYFDKNKQTKNTTESKVNNMKLFLGVLETDILKVDVGLSHIDPLRLANGGREETSYIAELLCWMGKQWNLFKPKAKVKAKPKATGERKGKKSTTPSERTAVFNPRLSPKSQLDLDAESLFQAGSSSSQPPHHLFSPFIKNTEEESITSLDSRNYSETHIDDEDDYLDDMSNILDALPPFTKPSSPPRCIHEIPSASLLMSEDIHESDLPTHSNMGHSNYGHSSNVSQSTILRDLSLDRSRPAIRYTGYIEPADEEFELASFEHSRSISLDNSYNQTTQRSVRLDDIQEQCARTRDLLEERARLLSQLAELKRVRRR